MIKSSGYKLTKQLQRQQGADQTGVFHCCAEANINTTATRMQAKQERERQALNRFTAPCMEKPARKNYKLERPACPQAFREHVKKKVRLGC